MLWVSPFYPLVKSVGGIGTGSRVSGPVPAWFNVTERELETGESRPSITLNTRPLKRGDGHPGTGDPWRLKKHDVDPCRHHEAPVLVGDGSLCARSLTPPDVHRAIELTRVHANQVPTTEVRSGILAGVGSGSIDLSRNADTPCQKLLGGAW